MNKSAEQREREYQERERERDSQISFLRMLGYDQDTAEEMAYQAALTDDDDEQ